MTHFTVGILVPEDRLDSLPQFVAEQMEPYDENTEVAPYVCFTPDRAKAEIDRDIRRLEQIISGKEPGFDPEKCEALLARLRATTPEERYGEYLSHHERFDPSGAPLSTCNPDSKWDWWVIGGRWDGWVHDREASGEDVADNMATTAEAIARGKIPHAIITPDGVWHERGQMGWWAVLLSNNENWDADARTLLALHPDCRVLILDAHI